MTALAWIAEKERIAEGWESAPVTTELMARDSLPRALRALRIGDAALTRIYNLTLDANVSPQGIAQAALAEIERLLAEPGA